MPEKAHNRPAGVVQYTTIKARLRPTPEQAQLFEKTFGCCRYIWNQMLSDQQRFYLETGKHFIPTPAKYKNSAPFLREVDSQTLIQEHNKLCQAFRVFFRNPEDFGHPKFKRKKDDRDSFTVCNHEFSSGPTIYLTRDGIRMTKAGVVRASFSRRPRSGWKLKRIIVEKTRSGRYYCCILYAHTVRQPSPVLPAEEGTLGLKYSMSHFYVDSEGTSADPPRWLEQSQDKLAGIQRRLGRTQPGSRHHMELAQKYRRLHEHIANQRRDYIHKESRRIANVWDAVCVRADDLRDIAHGVRHGNPQEAGFGSFRECLRYKLERQGKALILVSRGYPSSRICHQCGYERPEGVDYRRRTWVCPECGAALDREVNAARNIKRRGLEQAGPQREGRASA